MTHTKISTFVLIYTFLSACAHQPTPPPQPGPPGGTGPCLVSLRGFSSVHEFALPKKNSFPAGITAGPDGNVWFTEKGTGGGGGSKIGRITTDGVITEFPLKAASGPIGIVLGADGNLWFAEVYVNKIGVMTPAGTLIAEYTVPTANSDNKFVTEGPDGSVWFTETVGNKIGRITTSGTITEFKLSGSDNSGPQRITAGPDGNLWFTYDTAPRDAIGRITPSGVVTLFLIPRGTNVLPDGITTGPDGNLWFTEQNNVVGVVTTSGTFAAQYPVPGTSPQDKGPAGIALGPDGRLYFTEGLGSAIGWIVPGGGLGFYAPIPSAGAQPSSITLGPDHNIWFTEDFANKIGCIAPLHH